MRTFKSRVLSGIGAALVTLSLSLTSAASWSQPDYSDVTHAVANITAEVTKILALVSVDADDVQIVNVEDILTGDELVEVEDTLNNLFVQLELVSLHNVLNVVKILNGNNVLTLGDVLSNNDVDVSDVIGVKVFPDGKLIVFHKD